MILAGDVGGTKAVLALCEPGPPLRIVREAQYACAEHASLEAILDEFLGGDAPPAIEGACFGVAGPVAAGTAKITNLPWTLDERTLSARLGGAPVGLLNDLQATALGALALPESAFATLQAGEPAEPGATIAVIAPGTGLGEAVLVAEGGRYRALPSEGGHADFAAGTDEELALFRFLRARHGGHVSNERILSGAGIGELFDFVRGSDGPDPAWLAEADAAGDRNAAISRAALDRSDPTAVHALALFAAILGAEAGNLALRSLATGGVVIGGGIPPKILPLLAAGGLIARFNDKGRFASWTRARAVRVILEPRAALIGAAVRASTHLHGEP